MKQIELAILNFLGIISVFYSSPYSSFFSQCALFITAKYVVLLESNERETCCPQNPFSRYLKKNFFFEIFLFLRILE
jgi:hypothetical protein